MSDSTNEAAAGAAPVDEGPNGHGSLGRLIPWPDESTYPNIPADVVSKCALREKKEEGRRVHRPPPPRR